MADLILHHYPLSPYSEKVRAMLGYTNLHWYSVQTREMPPRPELAILAGGYRRIPVAQDGADIFCDTRIIGREIAVRSGHPELDVDQCDAAVQQAVARAEEVFFACVLSAGSLTLTRKALRTLSLLDLMRLVRDRMNMGKTASVRMVSPKKAPDMVKGWLAELERELGRAPFLFGATPNVADFAAYHGLWLIREGGKSFLRQYPKVMAWMDRIRAFGHGQVETLSAEAALDRAKAATPGPLKRQTGPTPGSVSACALHRPTTHRIPAKASSPAVRPGAGFWHGNTRASAPSTCISRVRVTGSRSSEAQRTTLLSVAPCDSHRWAR
ncbi:glutathione S-transferase family protein [Hahella sp. SMD15-11]|uniref:Glutathione S-transferase family protein n=1 Tax=Thermohahella caldifontis TaxID=3142973 RepID=A0AB39UTM0_9GAMM